MRDLPGLPSKGPSGYPNRASRRPSLSDTARKRVAISWIAGAIAALEPCPPGAGVIPGYRRATEPLRTFGAALSNIPANQIERVKTDYATVELADAANLHGIEVLGLQRAKAKANEREVLELEAATLSTDEEMNTQIAVLNKINAAGMMAIRASQDTNQLLVAVLEHQIAESKRRRDAEAAQITDTIEFQHRARPVAVRGISGTASILQSYRLP